MSYYRKRRNYSQATEKRPEFTDPAILERITALGSNPHTDDWTRGFCESITEGFKKYNGLTEGQYRTFIQKEAQNNPDEIAKREDWRKNYSDEMREDARIVARYYLANPPYFGDLARRVLVEDDFIPTQKAYRSMVNNKYAQKVLKVSRNSPSFANGSMVLPRASAPWAIKRKMQKGAIIIEPNSGPIVSAARGANIYTVLPVGCAETLKVQERWIKKARKIK